MLSKEWTEVWKLYMTSGQHLKILATFRKGKNYRLVQVLLILAVPLIVFGSGILPGIGLMKTGVVDNILRVLGSVVFPLVAWRMWVEFENVLKKEFAAEYEAHGLAQYQLSLRWKHLHYAIFLRGLVEQEYSHNRLERLIEYAKKLIEPEPTVRFAQLPLVVSILTLITVLTIELIKQTPLWANKQGLIFPLIFIGILFLGWRWWSSERNLKNTHEKILQFLQRAELEIDDQKREWDQKQRAHRDGLQSPPALRVAPRNTTSRS